MAVLVDVAAAVRSDQPSRQVLAGRAGVMVVLSVVHKVLPGEEAALGAARCQCLWHTGQHPGVLAGQDLIAIEIAPISQDSDLLVSGRLLRLERHRHELCSVLADIGHFVRHDQVVLDVDGGLHVVAEDAGSAPAGGHGPRIRIGQRHLLVGHVLNRLLHLLQGLHLSTQADDLFLQADRLDFSDIALVAVGPVQCRQVTRDAGVDLLDALADDGPSSYSRCLSGTQTTRNGRIGRRFDFIR